MVYRFSCILIPNDSCFTLICNTDCCNIFCCCTNLVHCFYSNTELACPDFICVMLYPAWLWKILCKLSLCYAAHFPSFVEKNTSVTGCTCIQRHYIFCHFKPSLFFETISVPSPSKRNHCLIDVFYHELPDMLNYIISHFICHCFLYIFVFFIKFFVKCFVNMYKCTSLFSYSFRVFVCIV